MKVCIFGLPRSRTAWFAEWLGAEHEALSRVASLKELPERISDTATIFAPALLARYPDARYLIVFRDPTEVYLSCLEQGLPTTGLPMLRMALENLPLQANILRVEFERIDAELPQIWEHLIGGEMKPPPGHIEADCAAILAGVDWKRTQALLRECGMTQNKES